jgi:putative methyltransferase
VLLELLEKVPLLKLEKETFRIRGTPSGRNLILVLLHDLLFSTRTRIEASDKWPPKGAIIRHQARLKSELVRIQLRAGVSSIRDLGRTANSDVQARYVRWNPNIDASRAEDWSLSALHKHLVTKGFSLVTEAVYPVPRGKYFMDPHLPDYLLVFPPDTNWWAGDRWYESGAVVLQDKASCFPAAVIMDGWDENDGECIDGTAAPGNKTSLMSALMGNKGTLHAFEKSAYRFKTLEKMLARAGCTNTTATRGDFTQADPSDYPNVTRILLDPSCSGSGIVNRLDYLVEQEESEDDDRLDKLAAFQLQMIQHAFKFPAVKRIVYSTCSIHAEEDERVVAKALKSGGGRWRVAPRSSVLPSWERRGRVEELGPDAEGVIRCLPEDKTNGFFVSCFERVEGSARKGKGSEGEKRKREEVEEGDEEEGEEDEEAGGDDTEPKASKPKTAAQLERARRKKQQQKKKKRRT